MNIARALLLLVFFLIVPRAAHACGCYPNRTVVDDHEKTDLVIIARMKSVTKGPSRFFSDISHVTMTVEKVFKGDTKAGAELTFIQGDSTLDCSWEFYADQVGETYLLYLYQPEKPSEPFYVSTCNRSKSVEYARWFTLRPKKHFGANIRLRLANRIAGRVLAPAGQPLDWVCVSLVETENSDSPACNSLTEADGTFDIESVGAGSYRLLINYQNIRSTRQPFPKMYYPGVASAEAAQVFTVKFGESIEGLKFVVPTLYERVKLQGIVRYANGRPANGRRVTFSTPKTAEVDGNISATTDRRGRFSLTVLKGLHGEIHSSYNPDKHEFVNCPPLEQTGKTHFETPHLQVEATENKTVELNFPCHRAAEWLNGIR